jgi:hypothetical protein
MDVAALNIPLQEERTGTFYKRPGLHFFLYMGAVKSLVRPTSLSIVFFFQSREQVVVRRGQIQTIGWVIKTLEAQLGQFLLGCKWPVSRFLPGRAKDLSAPLYPSTTQQSDHNMCCHNPVQPR